MSTPITTTFAAAALAGVPGRRLERFDVGVLCRIAQRLEHTRCIPLPGAHVARLRRIRQVCGRFASLPAPARRAAVALGLLGRTDSQGRFRDHWNLRHWRPVVHQWFDAFADEVPPVAVADRAAYLLIALFLVALSGTTPRAAADPLRSDLSHALDRLAEPHRATLPMAMPIGFDPAQAGSDAEWRAAAAALADEQRGVLVRALYCMHAFHAMLDCRQPDPDRVNRPAFRHLYGTLLSRLRGGAGSRCCLRVAAGRVASGLPLLGPFSSVAPTPVTPFAAELPPCFRAFEPRMSTTPWPYVRELLAAAGAGDGLHDEQALAEACADQVIDVLRVELHADAQTGCDATYGWLESCARTKYGPSVHWSLFNRLKQGALVNEARSLLGAVEPGDEAACSICRVGGGA